MVSLKSVEQQLERAGAKFRFLGKPEVRELTNILVPGETITSATNGFYRGGMALLCTTDHRVLLIDKKPWFLTLEDIRYDTITEVDYRYRMFNATSEIHTITKSLEFRSWNQVKLRKLTSIVQEHLMHLRQMVQNAQMAAAQQSQQQSQYMQQLQAAGMSGMVQPVLHPMPAIGQMLMRPRIGKFTLKTLR